MKKLLFLLLISLVCVFDLSAQKSFVEIAYDVAAKMGVDIPEGVTAEQLLECCNEAIEKFDVRKEKTPMTYALRRTTSLDKGDGFTERVRIPDASKRENRKYYYLKNVKTGMYMHFEDLNSPLRLTATPNEKSRFFFVNDGIGGHSVSFVNNYCGEKDVFYGPAKNYWSYEGGASSSNGITINISFAFNNPRFAFNVTDDNKGFYISDKEAGNLIDESEGYGEVWTYNPSTGNIVVTNWVDDYAVWVAEPVVTTSLNVSNESDTTWYVLKNVENGKYLHYEGANTAMRTVTAPDTCSLFYGLSNGTFGNFKAGNGLLCAGVDEWNSTGSLFGINYAGDDSFYINQYGKQAYWSVDENGVLVESDSYDSNSSKWQFEEIKNFKEIFGLSSNWNSGNSDNLLKDALEILDSGKITPTQAYASIFGFLVGALYGSAYLEDVNQVHSTENTIGEFAQIVEASDELLNDMSLFNADYLTEDENGNIKVKGLATNTTSLIVNDMTIVNDEGSESILKLAANAEQRHTNMWKFYMKGLKVLKPNGTIDMDLTSEKIYFIFYNTATKMYVSSPQYDEAKGEWSVTMTSNEADAGRFVVENLGDLKGEPEEGEDELFALLRGYYGTLQFLSKDVDGCFLYLASPDDIALSCRKLQPDESVDEFPGVNWVYVAATSVIDEKIYGHAQDAVNTYPGFLQDKYGLVQEGCNSYISNYPLLDGESSYCNLTDEDAYSAFRTSDEGNTNGELHYLQADLGEDNAVQAFSFYIKANLNEYLHVPASITVSGSNTENGEFVVIAENIEMPHLLYDMYYFSEKIVADEAYRYLRFTVNSVNAVAEGASEREFTLSEFYVFPDNEFVDKANEDINGFFDEEYLDMEIVDPAVVLMKQKADYLLEVNKNNHSEEPVEGQYPTSKYNALRDACDALDYKNEDTINALFKALEEFENSLVRKTLPAVVILESAWAKNMSLSCDADYLVETNLWDLNQWINVSKSGDVDNPYYIELYASPTVNATLNLDVIDGWQSAYNSKYEAYNAYMNNAGSSVYVTAEKAAGSENIVLTEGMTPAAVSSNMPAAWYLIPVSQEPIEGDVDELPSEFIEYLALFGDVMEKATYYYEGEKAGTFVYVSNDGLTKIRFDQLYNHLDYYYELGPAGILNMFLSGGLDDEDAANIMNDVQEIVLHFPNFVFFNGYFRLRGQSSGNYLVSKPDGTFLMMPSDASDQSGVNVELKSIYYTQPSANMQYANVLSFEDGRYLCADNEGLKYDRIPEDGKSYEFQTAFVSQTTGVAGLYNSNLGNNCYFIDNTTSVGVSTLYDSNDATFKWDVEIVDELPVVISSVKFATFYSPMELQIPNGVVAYVVYGEDQANGFDYNLSTGHIVEKGTEVFHVAPIEGGIIPAGTPVLLNAVDAGTYYFKINYIPTVIGEKAKRATYNGGNEDVVNLLDGRHAATYIAEMANHTHYILANKAEKGVGMYKVITYPSHTKDGVTTTFETPSFLNNAHRAWLPMPAAMSKSASSYVFAVWDRLTGVEENVFDDVVPEDTIYDLQGRRLKSITSSGIYIVNGKRVFVK